jgi:hypothetical protein
VLVEAFLGRLVVVGRHGEEAAHAERLDIAHELDHLARVVAARAGQDRHAARRLLDHQLDDAQLLAMAERRRLAGRAARRHEVNARIDLPPHEPPDSRLVNRPVVPEGVTSAVPTPVNGFA